MTVTDKPSVLVLSFTDHRRDPRVARQVFALRDNYDLTTAGHGPSANGTGRHVEIVKTPTTLSGKVWKAVWLKSGQYLTEYWHGSFVRDAWTKLAGSQFDLVIANDLETLPLACRIAGDHGKVYLDAHEYEPLHWENRWTFRFFWQKYWDFICREFLPRVDHMTTVCDGIAKTYTENYGVPCEVVINAPDYSELEPTPVMDENIRIIHHGAGNRDRHLLVMLDLMPLLDERFSLDLMLVNNDARYVRRIQERVRVTERVRLIEPVPMPQIVSTINSYDIGLFVLWPVNFNYEMALPNKFFEFIQARLAVAIWPSSQMKKIVDEEGLGVVTSEFSVEEMARKLNQLSADDVMSYKRKSCEAAKKYNANAAIAHIREAAERLISR